MNDEQKEVIYNKDTKVLYKETEDKYKDDLEVDQDDLHFLCQELYQHEILSVFGLQNEPGVDFIILTNKIEALYNCVRTDAHIMQLLSPLLIANFFEDELTTFITLFSYNTFAELHTILLSNK